MFLYRKFGIEVHDFGPSWRDGRAFSALINGLRPDVVDMSVLAHNSPCDNLELAFTTAEQYLGISRLLDVEGMKYASLWRHSLLSKTLHTACYNDSQVYSVFLECEVLYLV